jgi:hypothetical protein
MTKSSKKNLKIKLKKYKILHNSSMIIYEKFNNKASKKKNLYLIITGGILEPRFKSNR